MKDSYISNENADVISRRRTLDERQHKGIVDSVSDDGTVSVRFSPSSSAPSNVTVQVRGDDYIPNVEDEVIVEQQSGGEYAIVGSHVVHSDEKRATNEGERYVGHPSTPTNVHFHDDGSLTITVEPSANSEALEWHFDTNGETSLSVPPSSSPVLTFDENGMHFADDTVMTDVNTTTDGDGHVTSVTPQYTQTISL
jgi:hypothetical protein